MHKKTYRVSKLTLFPTHKVLSHSREENAAGSSTLALAFEAIRGADTPVNVKVTRGAGAPGTEDTPRRTTVSPLNTDCTLAEPRLGRIFTILIVVYELISIG